MSSPHYVGFEENTGVIQYIYVHVGSHAHDSGEALIRHYNNKERAKTLILMGSRSEIEKDPYKGYPFRGGFLTDKVYLARCRESYRDTMFNYTFNMNRKITQFRMIENLYLFSQTEGWVLYHWDGSRYGKWLSVQGILEHYGLTFPSGEI